jgi:pimeloyl-ACP methyl ester carboxylesterase
MNKAKNEERIMGRRDIKLHFDDEDMDFNLMWVLGQSGAGGAELGECLSVASRIKDTESWVTEWTKAGQRLESQAQAAERASHSVSAREAYLRAFSYYQASIFSARPQDKRLAENWRSGTSCFQKAAALLDPPIVPIEVPFQPFPLHGYFMPAAGGAAKAPTLIYVTGGEGWAEHAYFWVGGGRSRGYNIVAVDLPVHVGSRLRYPESLPVKDPAVAIDSPLNAILDWTGQRPDVDGERVALIGFSIGAYFALRSAVADGGNRIKALIADSPISDPYSLSMAEFPPALLKAPVFVTNLVGKIALHQNTMAAITAERTCWQFGMDSLSQLIEFGREVIDPGKIHCPTLCLASEGEAPAFLTQTHEVYGALKVTKKLHIFSIEEGADAHCQVNNVTLMQEVVYDWLDEILGR